MACSYTKEEEKRFINFTKELKALSEKYGVVIESCGSVYIYDKDTPIIVQYSDDVSSGDLSAEVEEINVSDKDLIRKGWATVGGRVEDFISIAKESGVAEAYKEIKRQYPAKDVHSSVYRGMLVCMKHGSSAYYSGIQKKEIIQGV